MRLSARNVLKGLVRSIATGAVNSEVIIEIGEGVEITSIITNKSCESLDLGVGGQAYAVIKASDVMLGAD
jgi:molybdopterin-binding protein